MSIGRIGALGSYSGSSNVTQYGVPPQVLAMAYQPPYGRVSRPVQSPWRPVSRIGKPSYGSAPMEWVTPLAVPLDARQNFDLIRAAASMPRVQGFRSRQPTVAALGGWGAMRDPMADKTTGAQGGVFSPGWFADLFTVSPGEKAARAAKKKVKQDHKYGLQDTRAKGKADAKVARASRAKGKSTVGTDLLATGSDLLTTFAPGSGGNAMTSQPTGSDTVVPLDLEGGEVSALPVFVKPLAVIAALGVVAAIGYKMLNKKKSGSRA